MITGTRIYQEGDRVRLTLPEHCLTCEAHLPTLLGTVIEPTIYGGYIVTLDNAAQATGYDEEGDPVHVCGLRLIIGADEMQPDWMPTTEDNR